MVRQWQRQFDQRVEVPARQVEKLRHNLSHDLGSAVNWLNEMTQTLAAYAELSLGSVTPPQTEGQAPSSNSPAKSDAAPAP